jgi:glycosyltransferase involved in cell wall biosynthesis
MMHIAFVSHLSGHGGIAVYNRTMAKALADAGYEVSVITSRQNQDQPAYQEINGVKTYRLFSSNLGWLRRLPLLRWYERSLSFLLYSFRVAKQIKKLDHHANLDIVEFAEAGGEGFAYLLQKHRLPVIVRCHTPTFVLQRYYHSDEMPYDIRLVSGMEKYCIRHADALTAPSFHMAQTIASDCDISVNRIKPIPNPLDLSLFASSDDQLPVDISDVGIKILHIGRLERVKGIEILVQAIPEILREVPQAKFVFIGAASSDSAASYWKQRLEKAGNNSVIFLGFLEFSDMLSWYRSCNIAVVPSVNYESFSYTCAQAMAVGLPVVASRIGGIPETVGENIGGLLTEPGDVAGLVKAIVLLAHDAQLRSRMGNAGIMKARNEFDSQIVAKTYAEFLQKII